MSIQEGGGRFRTILSFEFPLNKICAQEPKRESLFLSKRIDFRQFHPKTMLKTPHETIFLGGLRENV